MNDYLKEIENYIERHTAPQHRFRPAQVIELYHAAVTQAAPRKPKSAAWLAAHGYLHRWRLGREPRYVITRKGWLALKANWGLIADRVHGYPKVKR